MNRYAAAGIALDIAQGKHVIVLTSSTHASREALDVIAPLAPEASRVSRANGAEQITCPSGGRVKLRSVRQGTRGLGADIIYLDEGVDAELRSTDPWDSIRASLVTSPHAEVIRS